MTTYGTLAAFDPQVYDLQIYADKLEHYFIAIEIADAGKKLSIFLSVCGTHTYKLLQSGWEG